VNVQNKLNRFASKDYRDAFMQTQVRAGIAYQIQALRRKFGLTQAQMAEKTGKKQSVISRLESTEYGGVSVQSLLDIASALDIALVVRFSSYPDFLSTTSNVSEDALQVDTISESLSKTYVHEQNLVLKNDLVAAVGGNASEAAVYNNLDQIKKVVL